MTDTQLSTEVKTWSRDEILDRLEKAQAEQDEAERILIAKVINTNDVDVHKNIMEDLNCNVSNSLLWPLRGEHRNILDAIYTLQVSQIDLDPNEVHATAVQIAGEELVSLEYVERLFWDVDPGKGSPFAESRKIIDLSIERWSLGQRVWRQALYRWFDLDGMLLYVGITGSLASRQESHAKGSSWSRFAATCEVTRYSSRRKVETAEKLAIRFEEPLFNHTHNDTAEARERLVKYLVAHGHLDLLGPVVSRG